MVRKPRNDGPATLHHVFNRGIARRMIFEGRDDRRSFMALLGCAVRRGDIRLRAFTVMGTHYHLFVESSGQLARCMQRIQTAYSRRFNRRHDRDGPLMRSRYASLPVDSRAYQYALVHYIDQNPVAAGLVDDANDYEFGSAWYLSRGAVPRWLDASWLEYPEDPEAFGRRYVASFRDAPVDIEEITIRRLGFRHGAIDPMDELLGARPDEIKEWMIRNAINADGPLSCLPIAKREWVLRHTDAHSGEIESVANELSLDENLLRKRLVAGLLRHLCGLRLAEIVESGLAAGSVSRHVDFHRLHLVNEPAYARLVASISHAVLGEWPSSVPRQDPDQTVSG